MADYWGLAAIAHRLGVSQHTVWRWHRERGFLMMRRRGKTGTRWYTNDGLILAWERERCEHDRQASLAASKLRRDHSG